MKTDCYFELLYILSLVLSTKGNVYTSCDFEDGFCGWTNWNWTRSEFQSPLEETGPDKAYMGRFYIYSHGREIGYSATATLEIGNITGPTTYCLLFNYHMRGSHIEKLEVKWKDPLEVIWKIENEQGDKWNCAAVNATSNGKNSILFLGTTGKTNKDLHDIIGLDNIKLVSPTDSFCNQQGCNSSLTPRQTSSPSSSTSSVLTTASEIETSTVTGASWFEDNIPYLIGVPVAILLVSFILIGVCVFQAHHKRSSRSTPSIPHLSTQIGPRGMTNRYDDNPTNQTTEDAEYVYPEDVDPYYLEVVSDNVNQDNMYLHVIADNQQNTRDVLQNGGQPRNLSVKYQNTEDDYIEPNSIVK